MAIVVGENMKSVHFVLMLVVLTSLSGCLGGGGSSQEATGAYVVESTMTAVEVEAKSAYYQDGQAVDWTVESGAVADALMARPVATSLACCSP